MMKKSYKNFIRLLEIFNKRKIINSRIYSRDFCKIRNLYDVDSNNLFRYYYEGDVDERGMKIMTINADNLAGILRKMENDVQELREE